ncbi:MAG: hypothetical protein AABX14_01415, partial [Candidatus Aenigmatarchaeota archaeon]
MPIDYLMNRKGYIGLSVFLILLAALFFYVQPANAGGTCGTNVDCIIEGGGSACSVTSNSCDPGFHPRAYTSGGAFACTSPCNCCPTSRNCDCMCVADAPPKCPEGQTLINGECRGLACDPPKLVCDGVCVVPTCSSNSDCGGLTCNTPGTCDASCSGTTPTPTCGSCGDGVCECTEDPYNCPGDCGSPYQPYNSACVSITSPSTLCQGDTSNTIVTMKNTGTNTWTAAELYRLGSQSPQDNTFWRDGRVLMSGSTSNGGQYAFSFLITAPYVSPGSYSNNWKMLREGVTWFGETCTSTVTIMGSNNPQCDKTAPIGYLDSAGGATQKGIVYPGGWALDELNQVNSVTIQYRGPTNADYSTATCSIRNDVCGAVGPPYESYPSCGGDRCKGGWGASVDTTKLAQGTYSVSAYACDTKGNCGSLTGSPKTVIVNQCYGVTCNSPPAPYCSGSTRVYYNSPGTCNAGTGLCVYSTGSSACPTSGCSGNTRQSGGCSGGSCYL